MPIADEDHPASTDYSLTLPGTKGPTGIDYEGMTFLRDSCPNGIEPTVVADPGGDYLRLCVQKGSYMAASQGEPHARDRCELRDGKLLLGTAVQYGFELRIEPGFPVVDARMALAQIKAPYYDADGGSPMFALRFERGHLLATVEHLYEAKDAPVADGSERSRYLSRSQAPGTVRAFDHHVFGNAPEDDKELQVRAIVATDGAALPAFVEDDYRDATTGIVLETFGHLPTDPYAWNRFRLCVAPTREKDFAGLIELHVGTSDGGEALVARAMGEFGHRGYADPDRNTGPLPEQAYQYFKIGPYRDKALLWGAAPAAIASRKTEPARSPTLTGRRAAAARSS